MNYERWEKAHKISPASPEAFYAELAWNAAMKEAKRICKKSNSLDHARRWLDSCITGLKDVLKGF